jgi:hypothetical protein
MLGVLSLLCLQGGNTPGLVLRLLLLEVLQQPVSGSFLAPALRTAWQQQQHMDLARAESGSSSSSSSVADEVTRPVRGPSPSAAAIHRAQFTGSSSSSSTNASPSSSNSSSSSRSRLSEMYLPELARALLDPLQLLGDQQAAAQVLTAMHKADTVVTSGTKSRAKSRTAEPGSDLELCSAAGCALSCISDAACRCSLACWVLTWHGCMLQQGGHYDSVTSR